MVVEPLPLALVLEAAQEYSKRFGWVRCVNCGEAMDLYMYRRRHREVCDVPA